MVVEKIRKSVDIRQSTERGGWGGSCGWDRCKQEESWEIECFCRSVWGVQQEGELQTESDWKEWGLSRENKGQIN